MKVLFTASVDGHIKAFHLPYLKLFKERGYEVHVASFGVEKFAGFADKKFNIPFSRSPFRKANINAYKELKHLMSAHVYETIHCHTPVAAVLTRLAARGTRKLNKTKVIYTAHGFHFFKGASALYWLLYYPVERLMAKYTDVLITINHEDYERAKNFKAKRVEYVPGVGVDMTALRAQATAGDKVRASLGVPNDAILLLSVGELNKNKNHGAVIRAVAKLNDKNIHYAIAGAGILENSLLELAASLDMGKQFHLLGFRQDAAELYQSADLFVFPSKREGLGIALAESMAAGLAAICSNTRGITELIDDGKGGYLVNVDRVDEFAQKISELAYNPGKRVEMSLYNQEKVKKFDLRNVLPVMEKIYFEM